MNIAETFRGLVRRWYIVVPGIILAVALAATAFLTVRPGYERTATQLLIPGEGTIPAGATNPFLFLGGLTQTADIIVRAMGSDAVAGEVTARYPGTEVEISRDPTTSGPVILYRVTADSDEAAAGSVDILLGESVDTLVRLQEDQSVREVDQITATTLTRDEKSTLEQRSRIMVSAVVGIGTILLTLLIASLVDGLARRSRSAGRGRLGLQREPLDEGADRDDEPADVLDPAGVERADDEVSDMNADREDDPADADIVAPAREGKVGRGSPPRRAESSIAARTTWRRPITSRDDHDSESNRSNSG